MGRSLGICVLLVFGGCLRLGFEAETPAPTPEYDHVWQVSVLEDRLSGPIDLNSPDQVEAGGLSLREAILIASSSDGSDLISFDEAASAAGSAPVISLLSPLPGLGDAEISVKGGDSGIVVDGSSTGAGFVQLSSNRSLISGLILRGFEAPVISAVNAGDVTIENNTIETTPGRAIELIDVAGAVVSRNTISDSVTNAIWVERSERITVDTNSIERPGANAVEVSQSLDLEIAGNSIMLDNKDGVRGIVLRQVTGARVVDNFVDPGSAWMIALIDASDNQIERNLIEGGDAGIVLDGDSDRNFFFQNIITNCAYDGFYLHSGADDNVIVHNTTHGCPSGVVGSTDTSDVRNNLLSDTAFVDPASYDFTLLAGDPAVDAGEDLGYDLLRDEAAQFFGSAPDLGAVESH